MRAEAIGKELKLFFYSVFHLAASAIEIFVQSPCCPWFSRQRGDDEARVGSLVQMLGFPDDPAFSRPALACLVTQLAKQASGLARALLLLASLGEGLGEHRPPTAIASQPEDVIDLVTFAPVHQFLPAEAGVRPQNDADARPVLTQAGDNALDLLERPG